MPPKMKTSSLRNKFMVVGLVLAVFALMISLTPTNRYTTPTAAAQQSSCTLDVFRVDGPANEVPNFPISGDLTSTLSVKSLNGMKSVVLVTATNANVLIGPVTVEPDPPPNLANPTPVTITAAKINPNQPASFSVRVTGSFQHSVVINVEVVCPLPPQEVCPLGLNSVSGDVGVISVTGNGTTSLSVAAPVNGVATVSVGSSTNANIFISPFVVGQTTPVTVTASKINPNLPASFSLSASDTVGHTVVANVGVNCPTPPQGANCVRSQGYWKNHPNNWPVQSLTLGTVTYTKAQLLSILRRSVSGNGLISLAHQLIAAKLNAAAGAPVPPSVGSAIAASDALIGGLVVPPVGNGRLRTSATSQLTTTLDRYNNGRIPGGPRHCCDDDDDDDDDEDVRYGNSNTGGNDDDDDDNDDCDDDDDDD